uniref:7TM_GPCR_Srx domain-containing protein n=1 Tax=Caenorhabditis tropicalis TaxID=1561998 RepID=A0A1I7SYU0_9PELO
MLSMSPFISSPSDQDNAKFQILQSNPCPVIEFFSSPVFVWIIDDFWINLVFFVIGPIQFVNCLGNVLFQTGCSIYFLYISKSSVISIFTRHMQQRFFIGSVVQAAVPTTLIAIPYVVITVASATGEVTQAMTNLLFLLLGVHGIIESITIIMAHQCYRHSVYSILNGKRTSAG